MVDLGNTVKLSNDTCVPVRYFLTDAEKYKLEALAMDIISLTPYVSTLTNILTVKSAVTNAVGFFADLTGSPLIQEASDFLNVEKPKEGIINPKESVERRAGTQAVLNRNQVKVEYLWFNDSKIKIFLTIFHTEPLLDSPKLKLSDILVEKEKGKRPVPVSSPPRPWQGPNQEIEISMTLDDSCLPQWRLLRIPHLHLLRGDCTISTLKPDINAQRNNVNCIFFATKNTDDTGKVYPYTFTANSTTDGTMLGRWDSSNSMICVGSPEDRYGGVSSRQLLNNCIPVVQLYNCHITKIVNGDQVNLSEKVNGKRNISQVLEWLWDKMKDTKEHDRMISGHRYWAISWDRSSKVYCLDMGVNDTVRASYRLVKKVGYTTIMVSDCWKSLS